MPARPHGEFLAGEVGEIAGVSGTTIGQWARRGYIRASQSTGDPHVYALEDVAEAAIVAALLRAGVRRPAIRRLRDALAADYGTWPLSTAPLAVTAAGRVVLRESGIALDVLAGGQVLLPEVPLEDVRLRLTPTPPRAPRRS